MADRPSPLKEGDVVFPQKDAGASIQKIQPAQTVDTTITTKTITNRVSTSKGFLFNVRLTNDLKDIY